MKEVIIDYIVATTQLANISYLWTRFYMNSEPFTLGAAMFCSLVYLHCYFRNRR